ncbi:uncharacterized protein LOC129599388 [Paramacrobiotus metropolitanus]|uniref:uncharacterized protein LOC129599388 n=1 Tax=Paramacrobiotus metropolitanus TaxID=2943436 RepID=UPI0024462CD0|nr:uncharacterized protein LOC129599388 [Paramacrobiotus metropolitanus]
MASLVGKLAVVTIYLGIAYAASKDEVCSGLADCSDAGTTCFKGRCVCWVDMSFSVGMTWACDVDSACEVLFPGHVCRPSTQCTKFPNKLGYCQPIQALQQPTKATNFNFGLFR